MKQTSLYTTVLEKSPHFKNNIKEQLTAKICMLFCVLLLQSYQNFKSVWSFDSGLE